MHEINGIFLPAGEEHLIGMIRDHNPIIAGKGVYQYHKYRAVMGLVKRRCVAVDIGAHVGLWTRVMSFDFEHVHAVEPVAAHRACWRLNMMEAGPATLHPCALGAADGMVSMHNGTEGSSGDTWVVEGGDVPLKRLDDFGLSNVDFIKVDNEGYELFALQGAEETLKRCRPAVCVEQKPGMAQKFGLGEKDAVKYLESLGATFRGGKAGDYFLAWD